MKKNIIQRTLALVLTIAALAMTQAAMAVSTFTIEPVGNGNTFKIKRSDTSKAETVKYYTISLSALAGVHFTKTDGEYTFPVGTDSYSVTVPETAVNNIAAKYLYYSGSGHTYRFLVADKNGFEYAHLDRTLTYDGYALTNDSPFGVKDVVIQTAEYTADDDGYDVNGYKSVSSSDYFNNAAPKGYFSAIGAQLRMTLSFEAKENDDAYEYLQLLVNNTSTCDNRSDCKDGDPGNINLSKYMAGFEMNTGDKDDTYRSYTFPVLSAGNNEGATNPWNHGTEWPLSKQKFNGNRATDGRIIIPTDFSTLVLRLNASGKSGSDEWAAKNVKAHIQAVDNTAPTLESITLAGGTYVCKTSCYITLAFSEPVIVTDTPELDTSWGSLAYLSGSGTNVLTFYRNELDGIGTALTVYSLMNVNQVSDLAGNAFSGTVSNSFPSVSAQKITLFDDYVAFKGLAGSHPVSSTPAEPNPSIGVHCGTMSWSLTLNSSYTRTYSNNTENDIVPGTGIITITGKGIYTGTVSAEFNTRWATSSVAFRKNHDGPTPTMTDQTFTYNQSQALKANSMTRSGYAFNGWNTEADGSGTAYADGQELTNPSSTGTFTNGATLTLYAQWTPITYTVRFHSNDGTDATADQIFTYDEEAQNLTANAFTRTGYHFYRWTTNTNGTGDSYTDTQEVSNLTTEDGAVIDLYAQWTINTYTVHFNANNGSGTMSDMAFTYNVAQNLTANTFSREGCVFNGWNTAADGSGDSYTDTQEVSNLTAENGATVTLYAQWTDLWGIAGGANGSEQQPYVITTTTGLDLLATRVNDGNSYSGNYFKLGADIAYDPTALDANGENYTAIGNNSTRFRGTFDGDGHSISGIRINKTGSTVADRYQGLFGYIGYSGTVQNVILDDAHITGLNLVGGITGDMSSATIKNCLVLNTAIVADGNSSNVGAISGFNSGTLTANYYHNCTLTKGSTTSTTNIGSGGNFISDLDGARSVHALALADGITASGESVTIGTDTYYASNTNVTFTYNGSVSEGYTAVYTYNDGSDHDITGKTFTMPASDATVSATVTDVWGMAGGANGSNQNPYIITTPAGLDLLAMNVNGTDGYTANNFSGKYFKLGADITYLHTTDWDDATSRENNFTAIGGNNHKFKGVFDGDGHAISGIRIYKSGSSTNDDGYQGLFSCTYEGSMLNVTLTDARITGYRNVGGIIGMRNYGQFNNCHVTNTVAIHAVVNDSRNHGGIVGWNIDDGIHKISGCTSAATISIADGLTGCIKYGGIVGQNDSGTIENCRTVGATVNGNDNVGAIVGNDGNGTYTSNYYLGCTVNGTANATNVGIGSGDRDGVRSVHALTLADGITASGQSVTISGVTYYASNTTVTLTYSGGSETFTMPDCDVIPLLNGFDNSSVISSHDGETVSIVLSGRTLYRDGDWNTLCLPFSLTAEQVAASPLAGWTLMELDTDAGSYGHITGFENSALYLNFKPATSIVAGTPYIVKWIAQPDLTISSTEEWNAFCESVNAGTSYAGKVVKLAADISVSTMAGTYDHPFEGTFDGDGHTLTVTLNNDGQSGDNDESYGVAPFRFTHDAVIMNLHVGGTVTTSSRKYAAGIVGMTKSGTNSIQNCRVSVEINSTIDGDGTHGGFVGKASGTVNISNCLFDGVLTTDEGNITHSCGGFVGWRDDPCTLDISNSLYAPADLPNGKYAIGTNNSFTFTRNNDECVSHCYYTTVLGDAQGADASAMSNDQLLTALGDGWQISSGKVVPKKTKGNVPDITNPVFFSVTVENVNPEDRTVVSQDGKVSFTGTYDALSFTADNRSILFLGAENTLYYPEAGASIGAFRAYFQINDPSAQVKAFVLNFGEESPTDGVGEVQGSKFKVLGDDSWYDLNGRRLSGKPTQKGIYVNNGRKVVIK